MLLEIFILKALENSSEKASHDELSRPLGSNASGHHVEELVLVQFS